jgi:hypothetical protein
MAPKRITHTHTRLELIMLKAALGKYADKKDAAVKALRAAGDGAVADQQADDLKALVGDVGDREGTTLERLGKLIAGLDDNGEGTTLQSTPAEAHAYDVGLPLLARRLRSIEGELRSFGRDDIGEWCVETANAVGGALKDHYGEQLPLENKPEAPAQPELMP